MADEWQELRVDPFIARDFTLATSAQYEVFTGQAGPVKVRCLALPEHEHYARAMVAIASDALLTMTQWLGPYPYHEFTIVETYLGWETNESAGLAFIDERVFRLPEVAEGFAAYRVVHEVAHQWCYNVIGSHGYGETWIDEGWASFFTHRFLDRKRGKHDALIRLPKGFEWLPTVRREELRHFNLYWTLGRQEAGPLIKELPEFEHLGNVMSMVSDRGSKVAAMIEARMGEANFLRFMQGIYQRYYFRILRVADFQRESRGVHAHLLDAVLQRLAVHGAHDRLECRRRHGRGSEDGIGPARPARNQTGELRVAGRPNSPAEHGAIRALAIRGESGQVEDDGHLATEQRG